MAVSHTVLSLLCHSALQCRVRAIDCIERLASEVTYYMLTRSSDHAQSLTQFAAYHCDYRASVFIEHTNAQGNYQRLPPKYREERAT